MVFRLEPKYLKLYPALIATLFLASCSFAPLGIAVPDINLPAGTTFGTICYSEVTESAPVNFTSVKYNAKALYKSGSSLGKFQQLNIVVFARKTDPLPGSPLKCILSQSNADKKISGIIQLKSGIAQNISIGGGTLAGIVSQNKYWIGVATTDSAFISLPGSVKLTNGNIQAFF